MKTIAVTIDEEVFDIQVPEDLIKDAVDFFQKMDADMDKGWQFSKDWVEQPNQQQRLQIVADKIHQAITEGNQRLALMMSAYVLHHAPETTAIAIDTSGDMSLTQIN